VGQSSKRIIRCAAGTLEGPATQHHPDISGTSGHRLTIFADGVTMPHVASVQNLLDVTVYVAYHTFHSESTECPRASQPRPSRAADTSADNFSWTLQGKSACTFCVGCITPHRREITVSTAYVRRVSLKPSLSDAEVAAYWKFTMEEAVPALQRVPGMRSVKVYSGAGGLRADIRYVFEMDDAGVYERLLATPALQPLVAKTYAAWDMFTATQTFLREVTPELIRALSST